MSEPAVVSHLRQLAGQAGHELEVDDQFDTLTVTVPSSWWVPAAQAVREQGFHFFDWLSAVDQVQAGMEVLLCVWNTCAGVEQLLLRTRLPADALQVASLTEVFAGANWAERETAEMFGIDFVGHPHLVTLLLPEQFEGHPWRKDFVLASRAARPWPGEKEPGESSAGPAPAAGGKGRPVRRAKVAALGVPDPSWGPREPASQQPEQAQQAEQAP